MLTCSVCGHLNDPSRVTCEECDSDLSDSPDWGFDYDDEGRFSMSRNLTDKFSGESNGRINERPECSSC